MTCASNGQEVGAPDHSKIAIKGHSLSFHGFVYSNGRYTTIDDPNASGDTFVFGINEMMPISEVLKPGGRPSVYRMEAFTIIADQWGNQAEFERQFQRTLMMLN